MKEPVLGEQLRCAGFALKGGLDPEAARRMIHDLADGLGMIEAPSGMLYRNPIKGRGGVGFTLFQPITESFIAVDAWPDLGGGYLVICSCVEFALERATGIIETRGFTIMGVFSEPLRIANEQGGGG